MTILARIGFGTFLILLVVSAAAMAATVLYWPVYVRAESAPHRFVGDRVERLVHEQGINPVALSVIVLHPVERVCFADEYVSVRAAARRHGVLVDVPREVLTPELSYGVFIIDAGGYVTYGALHRTEFTPPSSARCFIGESLALQFDATTPLIGGRLVDLDAPDLRPTMVEAL